MILCEALHGRAAMAGVGGPWPAMGSSSEGKGKGRGGGRGGTAWGRHGEGLLGAARPLLSSCSACCT
jgi:hypothetical protein